MRVITTDKTGMATEAHGISRKNIHQNAANTGWKVGCDDLSACIGIGSRGYWTA
jgi:hypothetical protein